MKYALVELERNENDTMKMYEKKNHMTGTQRKINYQNKRKTYLKQKKSNQKS